MVDYTEITFYIIILDNIIFSKKRKEDILLIIPFKDIWSKQEVKLKGIHFSLFWKWVSHRNLAIENFVNFYKI